jgi:hypothetical protein
MNPNDILESADLKEHDSFGLGFAETICAFASRLSRYEVFEVPIQRRSPSCSCERVVGGWFNQSLASVYTDIMKTHLVPETLRRVGTLMIISLALVLPFVVLELISAGLKPNFPVLLFVVMWALTFLFILILMPIIESLRARNLSNPFIFLLRAVLLTAIASILVVIVFDQMPCFLGVPNCD